MRRRNGWLLPGLLAAAQVVQAATANPTTTTAAGVPFGDGLRNAQTARAEGMAGALAAAADGVTAVGLNPAGVLATGLATLHVTHAIHVGGLGEEYIAYAQRLPGGSGFGVSLSAQHAGSLSRQVEDSGGNWAGEAGTYPVLLAGGTAAWAVDLRELVPGLDALRLAGGGAVRVISQQVDTRRWTGADTDVGLTSRPGGGTALALVVQHLGVAQAGLGLPRQFIAAAAWQADRLMADADAWLVEADLPLSADRSFPVRAGTEYRAAVGGWGFAIRAGWRRDLADTGAPGLAAGLGIRRLAGRFPFGLDYAWVPFGELGTRHAIALTLGIRPPATRQSEETPAEAPLGAPVWVFYPLRGEKFHKDIELTRAAEVTVKVLDERGLEAVVLFPTASRGAGTMTVLWDGRLAGGAWADLDHTYVIVVQTGQSTQYFEVTPKDE